MNWYCFLGHEYSYFNVIVSCLFALKILKRPKMFWTLPTESPPRLYPRPQTFPFKTQSSSTKQTLTKMLGKKAQFFCCLVSSVECVIMPDLTSVILFNDIMDLNLSNLDMLILAALLCVLCNKDGFC